MVARDSVFPMRRQWGAALDDAAAAPGDAVSIRLASGARNISSLPSFPRLTSLSCFDVTGDVLETIGSCRALESVFLENIKTTDLSPLQQLENLRILGLERCPKLASLVEVGNLVSLQGLAIIDARGVRNVSPLSRLTSLRALAVAGGMWSRMRVTSFEPLAALRSLEFLHLTNIAPDDESLASLAQLTNLKDLDLANFYSTREFATLARALPSTTCQWFAPYVEIGHAACRKCGATTMVMPTGKGTRLACKTCDAAKIDKHVRLWNDESAQP
jgi:hypothetical protein